METKQLRMGTWKEIAELVGIAAIVASLIFVGLQMKQSQEIAIAAQYHERAALAVANFHAMAEFGGAGVSVRRCAVEPTENRSADDIRVGCMIALAYFVMADNHLYQYESGFMEESAWQAQRRLLKSILRNPEGLYRILYQNSRGMRRESFLALCDQLIAEWDAVEQSN